MCLLDIDRTLVRLQYTPLFTEEHEESAVTTQATFLGTRLKVVRPGEGKTGGLAPGVGVAFKIDGEDTGGALSIVEHPFAVGALVPPHVHTLEDEISIILEGEIGFRSEDQEVVLGPGGYIIKPRGEVHAMWNAGSAPARMIEVISPAGFEGFFRDLVALTDVGRPEPEQVRAIGERYGLPFEQPDWLSDVIARYGLTPPRA
jgi:quercetin dioxygenase-like cupin family protein